MYRVHFLPVRQCFQARSASFSVLFDSILLSTIQKNRDQFHKKRLVARRQNTKLLYFPCFSEKFLGVLVCSSCSIARVLLSCKPRFDGVRFTVLEEVMRIYYTKYLHIYVDSTMCVRVSAHAYYILRILYDTAVCASEYIFWGFLRISHCLPGTLRISLTAVQQYSTFELFSYVCPRVYEPPANIGGWDKCFHGSFFFFQNKNTYIHISHFIHISMADKTDPRSAIKYLVFDQRFSACSPLTAVDALMHSSYI